MAYQITINVIYPLDAGRIVLRTEDDWQQNIEAASVDPATTTHSFRVTTTRPFFYFKPCVVRQSEISWAKGTNYLLLANSVTEKDIYPHFFAPVRGYLSDTIEVQSNYSQASHKVWIYHPPGYDENTLKRYPVLYMHDGKNLFLPERSFGGVEWRVDETMELLDSMNLIDKVIVIGIDPVDRMYEYTQPGYENYGDFLVNKLKPQVDAALRTLPDATNTGVMGSSLGGVVSFYLAWNFPAVFGKAACLSSTFAHQDDLMKRVAAEPKKDARFYIDSAWRRDNFEVTRTMCNLLAGKDYKFGEDLLYFSFPSDVHNEQSWSLRCHLPFQFFFGKPVKVVPNL